MSPRRRRGWLPVVGLMLVAGLSSCSGNGTLARSASAAPNPAPAPVGPPSYALYVPSGLPSGPVRLVVALHGLGGNGQDFGRAFEPVARAHGWILAAPTFGYRDWKNPTVVRVEDITLGRQLLAMLDDVAWRSGRDIRGRVFIVGFSRGAQLADRFALFHPERVAAVASLSAGTYTLPQAAADYDGDGVPDSLPLPFGTADMPQWVGYPLDTEKLQRVSFLVSVGSDDTNPNDLPRQWDPVLGRTRVARALTFEQMLERLQIPAQLTIVPGAKHQLTPAMTAGVDAFLSKL